MDEIHPGKFLLEKMLGIPGLSGLQLAYKLNVSHGTVADIVSGRRGISAEMALRLAKFFRTTPEYWLRIQMQYELKKARQKLKMEDGTVFGGEEGIAEFSPESIVGGEKESGFEETYSSLVEKCSPSQECANWKEQMRRSEFILQDDIENVYRVYERLGTEPVAFDTICYDLNLQGGNVSAILVCLELDEWVKRLPGDWVVRVK
ncbi:MAG: HigA family addiction module antitoxin [Candidatus Melainabacteria bacterium]|nr:HigA family addiction module antitoxin [Candidatus Melainabacteria bacterium]